MAKYNNAHLFQASGTRPTDEELAKIDNFSTSWDRPGMERHARLPTPLLPFSRPIENVAASTAYQPPDFVAPYDLDVVQLVAGCKSCGDTCTVDVQREPAAGGGFTSILDGGTEIDIEASEGSLAFDTPDEDLIRFEKGDKLRVVFTNGATDGLVGGEFTFFTHRA